MDIEIKNGRTVFLEFARNQRGTVVKTHIPLHGDVTYDVQVDYDFNPAAIKESIRIRDLPYRCLIWEEEKID